MLRRYRFGLRPGWLAFHVIVVAAVVGMILLGRWQLRVSEAKHFNVRNFGYSLQWWAFSAFAVVFWWRILRDAAGRDTAPGPAPPEPRSAEPVTYRRYVMPPQPAERSDPVHAAYNGYLAALAAQDAADEAANAAKEDAR